MQIFKYMYVTDADIQILKPLTLILQYIQQPFVDY
jgi:hypothetical protein